MPTAIPIAAPDSASHFAYWGACAARCMQPNAASAKKTDASWFHARPEVYMNMGLAANAVANATASQNRSQGRNPSNALRTRCAIKTIEPTPNATEAERAASSTCSVAEKTNA